MTEATEPKGARRLVRARRLILGAAAALAVAPGTASAASVVTYVGDGEIRVNGDDGINDLAFSHDTVTNRLVFAETGISTTSGVCNDTGDSVDCPLPPGEPTAEPGFISPAIINFELEGGTDVLTSTLGDVQPLPHIDAGAGDDEVTTAASADSVEGGAGDDTISTGAASDDITPGAGADVISGGTGFNAAAGDTEGDLVSYLDERTEGVIASPNGQPTSGSASDGPDGVRDVIGTDVEGLVGTNRADTLTGGSADDFIRGLGGIDLIRGLDGNDDLDGSFGPRDRVVGGAGSDSLDGGAGTRDLVLGGADRDLVRDSGGRLDRLFGGLGIDRLRADDRKRDAVIRCGPGANRFESVERDRIDPRARSC